MLNVDKSALECDLAETYHIYDYRELPASRVALFAVGLREDSRIKLKMNGLNYPYDTLILARCSDALALLLWSKTKDAVNGRNRPEMLVDKLLCFEKETVHEAYTSADEFEMARAKLLKEAG